MNVRSCMRAYRGPAAAAIHRFKQCEQLWAVPEGLPETHRPGWFHCRRVAWRTLHVVETCKRQAGAAV